MPPLAAGIEQADDLEQDEGRETGITEWQNDLEGLVAVYDTLVSVPDNTTFVYATKELQVMPSLLKVCGMQTAIRYCFFLAMNGVTSAYHVVHDTGNGMLVAELMDLAGSVLSSYQGLLVCCAEQCRC